MIAVNHRPFLRGAGSQLFVDEVTARPVAAVAVFGESVASLGFVGAIALHIDA